MLMLMFFTYIFIPLTGKENLLVAILFHILYHIPSQHKMKRSCSTFNVNVDHASLMYLTETTPELKRRKLSQHQTQRNILHQSCSCDIPPLFNDHINTNADKNSNCQKLSAFFTPIYNEHCKYRYSTQQSKESKFKPQSFLAINKRDIVVNGYFRQNEINPVNVASIVAKYYNGDDCFKFRMMCLDHKYSMIFFYLPFLESNTNIDNRNTNSNENVNVNTDVDCTSPRKITWKVQLLKNRCNDAELGHKLGYNISIGLIGVNKRSVLNTNDSNLNSNCNSTCTELKRDIIPDRDIITQKYNTTKNKGYTNLVHIARDLLKKDEYLQFNKISECEVVKDIVWMNASCSVDNVHNSDGNQSRSNKIVTTKNPTDANKSKNLHNNKQRACCRRIDGARIIRSNGINTDCSRGGYNVWQCENSGINNSNSNSNNNNINLKWGDSLLATIDLDKNVVNFGIETNCKHNKIKSEKKNSKIVYLRSERLNQDNYYLFGIQPAGCNCKKNTNGKRGQIFAVTMKV